MAFNPPSTDRVVGTVSSAPFVPPDTDRVVGTSQFEDTTEALARGMVRGIPLMGPALESGIEAVESFMTGRSIQDIRERGSYLQQTNPGTSTAGEVVGNIAGSAGMVMAFPTAFGAGAGGLATRIGLGAASGGAVGAADTKVRGGNPLSGAALGAAGGAGGAIIGGALGRVFARRAAAPTSQALKEVAGPLFDRARTAGVVVKPDPYRTSVANLTATLRQEGLDPILHPKATRALARLQEATRKSTISFEELHTLRRIVGAAAGSVDADERRVAKIAIEHLDHFMEKLKLSDVASGNPAAATAILRAARQLWTRANRAEIVEDAMERAQRAIASGTITEGTAIRGQFRRIANNKGLMRKFSKEEQAAIKSVSQSDQVAEVLKLIGGLRSMVIGGVAGSILGPIGSAGIAGGLMGVGLAGRAVAARSARSAAATVQELAATGRLTSVLPPSTAGKAAGAAIGLGGGLAVAAPGSDQSRY